MPHALHLSALIARFHEQMQEATAKGHPEANQMNLATVGPQGQPSSRIVLLKHADERGFVFYTNLGSHKARDIAHNAAVALNFWWYLTDRQIRVEGRAVPVSDAEADAYFASRPRQSQIGAWASIQSTPIADALDFEKRIAKYTLKFGLGSIPRPPFWSGLRVVPSRIEFWQKRDFRLHERFIYSPAADGLWHEQRYYP